MDDYIILKAELEKYKIKNGALEERVDELSDFIENASIPLHWVDGNGIILWANKAELDALGFTYDEYVGQPISKFHADSAIISDILTRLTSNETLNNYPARLQAKDGSIIHVLISSNVLRKDGKFVHTRCFTKNITEIKKEEERKIAFVAMVSHELKTPLTSLTSFVQVLMQRADKAQDSFAKNLLARAELQAKKMANMLNDFLNQAKYQDGKVILHLENFNLRDLVKEIVAETQMTLSKGYELAINCQASSVYADRDKIGQVFTNLISNAIKYSPAGGIISIQCENHLDKVQISITDNGIGINSNDQQRLFERFYRVKTERTSNAIGFGIGLYLVSEILRYHNSVIKVVSEQGRGSKFYFNLDLSTDLNPGFTLV